MQSCIASATKLNQYWIVELEFSWFALTTIGHHIGATQAPKIWGWFGLRLHLVIKQSPAHVLALYVPSMHHGYVGICLIVVHVSVIFSDVFTRVMLSHPGHNGVHKNSSQPLTTSVDGSTPSANPASAASIVLLETLEEEMLWSWYPVVAPSEEPRVGHRCIAYRENR